MTPTPQPVSRRFRKKPVIVEAEQFWPDKPLPFNERGPVVCFNDGRWYVTTIHGQEADLAPGDWVILESRGAWNAYPCKPDIFAVTYEAADAAPAAAMEIALAFMQEHAIVATGRVINFNQEKFGPAFAAAFLAYARTERERQREEDCKAVCEGCEAGIGLIHVPSGYINWFHEIADGRRVGCKAAAIRKGKP